MAGGNKDKKISNKKSATKTAAPGTKTSKKSPLKKTAVKKASTKKVAPTKIVPKKSGPKRPAPKKTTAKKILSKKNVPKGGALSALKPAMALQLKPLFPAVEAHYPGEGKSAGDVYKLIGGRVALNYHIDPDTGEESNSCTLRLCRALNYGGAKIKVIDKTILYGTGGDGLKYIYRVRDMIKQLMKAFGDPSIIKSPADADYRRAFDGVRGIIAFEVSGWGDATGHVTTWDGHSCGYHCYFDDADYINAGSGLATTVRVMLWTLP